MPLPFLIVHDDPHPLARRAAVRSAAENDPVTLAQALALPPEQRLREAFALSEFAVRLARARG